MRYSLESLTSMKGKKKGGLTVIIDSEENAEPGTARDEPTSRSSEPARRLIQ